ncbi:DUF4382 domain-containing protein [Lewinella sp. IMCC34191]|uniref:DUF4382 domain-containing protein n=1 Tax=Lewinella sp. IMCC34191 TaxID=2259172 RepID=UPI001300A86B|nr:DUF4382 domain-containing protein [Lewinella sp. IMCC34191]
MRLSNLSGVVTLALTLPLLTFSCKEDPATPSTEREGDFRVEMTDAPIDDAYVKAVVVTVADIKVDGESLEGFNRSTVEVSALVNGETDLLYSGQLAAKNYNKIELVLDDDPKAVNNGPGCYYINPDNQKKALQVANDGVITIQESKFSMAADAAVTAVIDFDLRKAFVRTQDETEPYALAAGTRLNQSLRFVEKDRTGMLTGTVTNNSESEGEIVVYAYKQGTYTSTEASADRDDELFLNAVSSSKVNANNEYTLSFLEAGAYELIAVSYKDQDSDGDLEIEAQFKVTATGGLDLGLLQVKAESTTTADFNLSFPVG